MISLPKIKENKLCENKHLSLLQHITSYRQNKSDSSTPVANFTECTFRGSNVPRDTKCALAVSRWFSRLVNQMRSDWWRRENKHGGERVKEKEKHIIFDPTTLRKCSSLAHASSAQLKTRCYSKLLRVLSLRVLELEKLELLCQNAKWLRGRTRRIAEKHFAVVVSFCQTPFPLSLALASACSVELRY